LETLANISKHTSPAAFAQHKHCNQTTPPDMRTRSRRVPIGCRACAPDENTCYHSAGLLSRPTCICIDAWLYIMIIITLCVWLKIAR